MPRSRRIHLMAIRNTVADRVPQVSDLAGADEILQHIMQFVTVDFRIANGMRLWQIDIFGLEGDYASLHLRRPPGGRPPIQAIEITSVHMPKFGGHYPLVAVAMDRVAD